MATYEEVVTDGFLRVLKDGGFNSNIILDGTWGSQGKLGMLNFLRTPEGESRKGIKKVIVELKNRGFNDDLVVSEWVGIQSAKACENFQKWLMGRYQLPSGKPDDGN